MWGAYDVLMYKESDIVKVILGECYMSQNSSYTVRESLNGAGGSYNSERMH